ncbi:MAG: DNA polymerase I [Peptostreptococcaceae bacterium]|nr:DNA polymerase I [Peptostreptococcaceae bacterium]
MKKKLVLLDGNSLFNRAFFALPPLMNKKGFYTNAIYGFATMTNSIIESHHPDYMAVAFDLKAPTFRHQQYGDYKAGRKGMPDELRMQVEPLKKMVDAMGIVRAEFEGYEADDIIGTLSAYGEEEGLEVIIVTGDKDALQLASQNTTILITKKGISEVEAYDDKMVFERYGLTPTEFIDLKALMGDKSDNIKGVAGIGEKTGIKLLQEYKSIEGIYDNIDSIKGATKTKLENDKESAFLSKKLAKIVRNMPIELDLEELAYKGANVAELAEMYRDFEFTSLLSKLSKSEGYESINPDRSQQDIAQATEKELVFDFDLSVFAQKDQPIYLAVDAEKISVSNDYTIRRAYVQLGEKVYVVPTERIVELKALLEEPSNSVIGHDLKTIYKAFLSYGIEIADLAFDTEIAEYVIDANGENYSIEFVNSKYALDAYESLEEILGKGKAQIDSMLADQERLHRYYKNVLRSVESLSEMMKKQIAEQGMEEVFYRIEMRLIKVLAKMEIEGFLIDQVLLGELSSEFEVQIAELEASIHEHAGEIFNINSPKQLGNILFEKLGLPHLKKTKTGYSTNIEVLEFLRGQHPIIEEIMEYRQITKLKSTYIDGLSNIIDRKSGKVHTTFSQTTASTGRLSSLDPNLQNIPIRTERGRKLRGLFIAKEGCELIDADYSQIELRILAHLADDKKMIQAFADNVDIHTKTASEVFGVPIDEVSSDMRGAAKAVNFGIVYGISDFGLSNNLGISIAKAKEYIQQYLDKYEEVKKYLDDVIVEVEQSGFAETIYGRRRYVPELKAKNAVVRGFGKRLAMNTPIQGAAADIIKLAMIEVDEYLSQNHADAKLLLQVHDELIIQARDEDAEAIRQEVQRIMEGSTKLKVELKVEAKIGKSWYDTK